jgi:hypothetical protein
MDPALKEAFEACISTTYKAARARNRCETNGAVQNLKEEGIFWGWMGHFGWRGGSDAGFSAGA